jgi:hypothetical protein
MPPSLQYAPIVIASEAKQSSFRSIPVIPDCHGAARLAMTSEGCRLLWMIAKGIAISAGRARRIRAFLSYRHSRESGNDESDGIVIG